MNHKLLKAHRMQLVFGYVQPSIFMLIMLWYDQTGPPPAKKTRLDQNRVHQRPTKPELKDLLKELYTKASEWMNIGVFLGIEIGKLDTIGTAENHKPQNCLREMLRIWLNRISPPPSWTAIAEAVEQIGDQSLADQLRTKSPGEPQL